MKERGVEEIISDTRRNTTWTDPDCEMAFNKALDLVWAKLDYFPSPAPQVPDDLLYKLEYIGNGDPESLHGDDYEVIFEDDEGREGEVAVSITDLCKRAAEALTSVTTPSIAEEREPEATLFHLDGMDYTEESAQDVAEYHGQNMPLNSSEVVTVDRYHQLPSREMKITVDAEGNTEWEWMPVPESPANTLPQSERCERCGAVADHWLCPVCEDREAKAREDAYESAQEPPVKD